MDILVVNLELGMPTVEKSRIRRDQAFRTARAQKQDVIKFIHGYGSSGKGGKIKKDVLAFLAEQKKQGKIREFVSGDDFSPFDDSTRRMLALYPQLYKDKDYSRGNSGITIVVL